MYSYVITKQIGRYMSDNLNFIKHYHSAVVKALGDDAKKVNSKVGLLLADEWADGSGKIDNYADYASSFQEYLLKELGFADLVKVDVDGAKYTLEIKGCMICHGNEILRKEGLNSACPIVQAARYAMVKKMEKEVVTKGVTKTGVVGECTMNFEVQ